MPPKGCEAWVALVKVFDVERVVNVSQHLLVEAPSHWHGIVVPRPSGYTMVPGTLYPVLNLVSY